MFEGWFRRRGKKYTPFSVALGGEDDIEEVSAEELYGAFDSCGRLKVLLNERRANPLLEIGGEKLVFVAAREQNINAFDMLFLRIKSPHVVVDKSGNNLAHYAAKYQLSGAMIEKLKLKGVNLAGVNKDGDLPLHEAIKNTNYGAVLVLLRYNTRCLYQENKSGVSPLDIYRESGNKYSESISAAVDSVLSDSVQNEIKKFAEEYSGIPTSNSYGELANIRNTGRRSLSCSEISEVMVNPLELCCSPMSSDGDGSSPLSGLALDE